MTEDLFQGMKKVDEENKEAKRLLGLPEEREKVETFDSTPLQHSFVNLEDDDSLSKEMELDTTTQQKN